MAALFAICFLYLFAGVQLGAASGDKGVFSRWFKLAAVNFSKVPFQGFVRLWFHMWSLFCHCFLLDSPSSGASGLGGSGTVRSDYAIFCVFPLLTPFLSRNIPSAPAYGVYVSHLIRYTRACSNYQDFMERGKVLTTKLLSQEYKKPNW